MNNNNPQEKLNNALRAYSQIETGTENDNDIYADQIRGKVKVRRRNRAITRASLSGLATIFLVVTVLLNINTQIIDNDSNELDLWLTEVNYDAAADYVLAEVSLDSIETAILDDEETWILKLIDSEELDDLYSAFDEIDITEQERFLQELESIQIM